MSQHVDSERLAPPPLASPRSGKHKRALTIAAAAGLAAFAAATLHGERAPDDSGGDVATAAGPQRSLGGPDSPRRDGDAIVISAAFRDAGGIRTTPAVIAPLTARVHVNGAAAFDPKRVAAVGTRAPGIVTSVLRVEGDVARIGDVLAVIDSPVLAQAQADLRIARAHEHAARLNAEREAFLVDRGLSTAREREQAVAALEEQRALAAAAAQKVEALGGGGDARIGLSLLRAPTGGLVAERHISPGQSVEPGLVAFRVGDLDALWVLLRIFERDVQLVGVGDDVEVFPTSDPDRPFHGKVAHVGAVLDPATRATDVRLEVQNDGHRLRPGQSVRAVIHASGPAHEALAVPTSAITYVDDAPTVFVEASPGRFVVRKVELGIDAGERVEIVSGVRASELVVSEGVITLKSELFR